jgi:hypothetical protein
LSGLFAQFPFCAAYKARVHVELAAVVSLKDSDQLSFYSAGLKSVEYVKYLDHADPSLGIPVR